MASDTPRTDAKVSQRKHAQLNGTDYVSADFARQLERDLSAARAECERLRKDAERYRWLRNESQSRDDEVPIVVIWKANGHGQECCAKDELDAAIDAARKEGA